MPSSRARIFIERVSARNLILSDSTPKNKLIYQNTTVFSVHQKLHILKYGRYMQLNRLVGSYRLRLDLN
jgi:hypothetical protein